MARFYFDGIDELNASLNAAAEVEPASILKILHAGADILVAAWREKLGAMGKPDPKPLQDSITTRDVTRDDKIAVQLRFSGKHPHGLKGQRMKKENGKRRSSGTYAGTNAEIAYILEYGTPRMPATHWMETANDESEEAVQQAMASAWNEYLKGKGL